MTKEYFKNNVIMAIEVEYECGHREWFEVKGSEVDAFLGKIEKRDDEYFSDMDYCTKQEDPEIEAILDKAEQIWFRGEDDVHEKFGSLDALIDSFLTEEKQKRVWTEDEIRDLVQKDDRVLYGALKKLYAEQTSDEQASKNTKHRNGVGFNGVDAEIMSSFAEFLKRTGFLTVKQKAVARKKLIKYNKQLTRLANA